MLWGPDTWRWKWREYCTLLEPKLPFCFEVKPFFATDTTSQISRLFSPQFDAMSHSLNDVHFDTDYRFVVARLMQELLQNGPRLCPHSEPMSLSKTCDGITITLKDGSTQGPFDQVRLNADRFALIASKNCNICTRYYGQSAGRPPPNT